MHKVLTSIRNEEKHKTLRETTAIGEIRIHNIVADKVKSFKRLGRYVNGKILQQATNYRSHSKLAGLLDVRNIFLTCKQQVPNWLWG